MWNRSKKGEDGQSTVLVAVFLCFLAIGFLAIGIDVANLFYAKRRVQSAADAAALAAAQRDYVDNSGNLSSPGDDVYTAADQAMANNQVSPYDTDFPAIVKLNNPPVQGAYSTGAYASNYIEAIVSKSYPTYFLSYFNPDWSHVAVSARAVAGVSTQAAQCLCTTSASGDDLSVSNSGAVAFSGCSATIDSTSSNAVTVVGSGKISGSSMNVVSSTWSESSSNVNGGGSISVSSVSTGSTSCSSKSVEAPGYVSSSCVSDPRTNYQGGQPYSLGPSSSTGIACYSGGLIVGANSQVTTLKPGIYVINGGTLEFKSGANGWSNLGGQGVFFYLTNGASLAIDNGANTDLVAMSSGAYKGVLFYQDPSDTSGITLGGGASSIIEGDIVAPSAVLTDGNYESITIYGDVVVNKVVSTGSGSLTLKPNEVTGGVTVSPPRLVE